MGFIMSLYGYVKKKVVWWRDNTSTKAVDLTRYTTNISTQKDFEPSNNSCTIRLLDNNLLYENGNFLPEENDKVFVWAKIVEKVNDAEFTVADIIWNGKFIDHTRSENQDEKIISLKIGDWGYDVFNRYHGESYLGGTLRTNEIVKRIIEVASENDDRSYNIDTTNIATTRNDASNFPLIEYGSITKPTYEWLNELSTPAWCNSAAEIAAGAEVIVYPMILDFRGNEAHWFEQPLTAQLTIDNSTHVIDIKYSTSNEGSVSFLILDCGEDLNANSITYYIRDEEAETKVTKEKFKNQLTLAGKDNDYDNAYHFLRAKAIAEGWTNTEFRDKVKELANSFGESWFRYAGRGKRKITVTLPKVDIELGEVVQINRRKFKNGAYRVVGISQNIGTTWSTSLNLEILD